jgi:hypothetical protein
VVRERVANRVDIVAAPNSVRNDIDCGPGLGNLGGTGSDVYGFCSWFAHHKYEIDQSLSHPKQGSDAGLQVGDHNVSIFFKLPKQLLGRKSTSGSPGIGSVDPRYDYETNPSWCVDSKRRQYVLGGGLMLNRSVVESLPRGEKPIGLVRAEPERDAEHRVRIAVDRDNGSI